MTQQDKSHEEEVEEHLFCISEALERITVLLALDLTYRMKHELTARQALALEFITDEYVDNLRVVEDDDQSSPVS